MQFSARRCPRLVTQHRPAAFHQHERSDRPEKQHVAQRDQQLNLPQLAQQGEDNHADTGAREAAGGQHQAHFEVDIAAPHMGQRTRHRGGDDLVRFAGDRDGRRNTNEDQQRRHQKTTADAEQSRQKSDRAAQS